MRCAIYRERTGGTEQVDCPATDRHGEAALERLRNLGPEQFAWVHVDDPDMPGLERLADRLGLHPLAVEDAVHAHQRPKRERYGDVLAVAVKTLRYVEDSRDVETGEVMLFLGAGFALTVRHGPTDPTAEAARRIAADPARARFGPAAVLHAVLDTVVDGYGEAAARVRADLTGLERSVFSPARDDLTEDIYSLKREVLEFRDAVQPLVAVADDFAGPRAEWAEEARPYFRDVADHLRRTDTEVRSLDELLNSALDAHLARVSTWQNDDMRRISAWAAVLAAPTVVAALYGMRFDGMPTLRWTYGVPLALVVIATLMGLLYRAFRRNGWL